MHSPPHHAKERALSNLPLVSPNAGHSTQHAISPMNSLSSLPPFHPSPGEFGWDQGWRCGICQMSLWAVDEVYKVFVLKPAISVENFKRYVFNVL